MQCRRITGIFLFYNWYTKISFSLFIDYQLSPRSLSFLFLTLRLNYLAGKKSKENKDCDEQLQHPPRALTSAIYKLVNIFNKIDGTMRQMRYACEGLNASSIMTVGTKSACKV